MKQRSTLLLHPFSALRMNEVPARHCGMRSPPLLHGLMRPATLHDSYCPHRCGAAVPGAPCSVTRCMIHIAHTGAAMPDAVCAMQCDGTARPRSHKVEILLHLHSCSGVLHQSCTPMCMALVHLHKVDILLHCRWRQRSLLLLLSRCCGDRLDTAVTQAPVRGVVT